MLKAIVTFIKLRDGEKYHIGHFHKRKGSKILWPVRSLQGGYTNESRHLKTGREFYRVDLPLGNGAPIVNEK
jgi:hypothetical protein